MGAAPTNGLTTPPTSSAFDDRMRAILAVMITAGLFGFVGLSYIWPPQLPGDTVGVVLGYLSGWVSAIVSFYWGSSSGSQAKSKQLAEINKL